MEEYTKKLVWSLVTLFLIGSLAFAGFYYQSHESLFRPKPCAQPISYSLGSFDSRFNISQADFLAAVDQAAKIWDVPIGRTLFQYSTTGSLKINLNYDYRQAATDKLKSLGISIDDTKSSYESIKSSYNNMASDYATLKSSLDAEVASYNLQKQNYEQQVNYWNKQGGAPKNIYNQLTSQKASLDKQASKINSDQAQLNSLADNINALVNVLNRLAANLNLSVTAYNNIGTQRGGEFEEGLYIQTGNSREIDIYEYDSQDKLIRVLAHELGHALGLEHINSDRDAIMYYQNQSTNEKATTADITQLKQLCGIQ